MTEAMERAGWSDFDGRLAASRKAGKIRGIGMATYIEACAFPGSEPAFVELNGDGTVTLKIGTQTTGQGHATAYAQIVAERLNMPIDNIVTRQGDTDDLDDGGGTGGSRSIPLGGVSASRAGEALAEKIRRIAADELEASPLDIELYEGSARIVGTDRSIELCRGRQGREEAGGPAGHGRIRPGRVQPIRTARISARSRSTRRRARPRSSATPSSTISASP